MSKIKLLAIAICLFIVNACGNSSSNSPATAEGFSEIEKEIKNKFGDDAFYTDILISHDENISNIISLTVTNAPESLKMGQWNLANNNWTQSSEVTLEVPEGTKASDYMYQLNDSINLTKVGELIEKSALKLSNDKNIENPTLYTALVKYPKNGDVSKMEYIINMKSENGGTTFRFYYKLNGDLVKMDY